MPPKPPTTTLRSICCAAVAGILAACAGPAGAVAATPDARDATPRAVAAAAPDAVPGATRDASTDRAPGAAPRATPGAASSPSRGTAAVAAMRFDPAPAPRRADVVPIPPRSRHVGMNLAGVAYYSTEFPFADLTKSAMAWRLRDAAGTVGAAVAALTADGYPAALEPGQQAVSAVAWNGSHHPAGRYVLRWDGDGALSFPMSRVRIAESSPHRIAVDVTDASGALWIGIDRTNPADPVRNVRFLWPGTEASAAAQPFNPAFLAKVAPFSVLRFMDWGATNGSPVAEWADRARPGDATYANPKGVPLELMIALANTLHADPWFCIPHRASDDYVARFAALLHATLDPALRPHIEYSNEVWNSGFAQHRWAVARSDALGLPKPSGLPSAFYAQRATEIFAIVEREYGADRGRLVRVLGGQAVWSRFQDEVLAWRDTAARADALAVAPYFNAVAAGRSAEVDATTAGSGDRLVDRMLASIRGDVTRWIVANAALARRHGLVLMGYEGGPGDTAAQVPPPRQAALTAALVAAHRSPRMRAVMAEYVDTWVANGGATLNLFFDVGPWSKWGLWGALEYVTQDPADAPKYQGLLDAIAAHPAPPR